MYVCMYACGCGCIRYVTAIPRMSKLTKCIALSTRAAWHRDPTTSKRVTVGGTTYTHDCNS